MRKVTDTAPLEKLMTIEEVAEIIGVPVRRVREELVGQRRLLAVRVARKQLRFRPEDVREWIAQARVGMV